MKKIVLFLAINLLVASSFAQKVRFIKNATDSLAYAIGVSMYQGVSKLNVDLGLKLIYHGLKAADKEKAFFTSDEANEFIRDYMTKLEERLVLENKESGVKFLEENKSAEGIVVTESGLQYRIIEQGEGPLPAREDRVKVHYSGFLLDGTSFDSSKERGEPAVFGVTQVIKGWTEVLLLMRVGSNYEVFIPSELAYGDRSTGEHIKPGSVLVFEIELLEIMEK